MKVLVADSPAASEALTVMVQFAALLDGESV